MRTGTERAGRAKARRLHRKDFMARISSEELLARLEKGKTIPAILLLGEEPYLRDSCRELLIERFVPEGSREWAVSRYSAGRGETQAAMIKRKRWRCFHRSRWCSLRTQKRSKSWERKTAKRRWRASMRIWGIRRHSRCWWWKRPVWISA